MEKLDINSIINIIKEKFSSDFVEVSEFESITSKQLTLTVDSNFFFQLICFLRYDKLLDFNYCNDITACDYLNYNEKTKERYALVYYIYSFKNDVNLRIKVWLNENNTEIESVFTLWKGSEWLEREVYDMFGISFKNHPDLRRLFMPDSFKDYPLLKDYPLQGKGERTNFPTYKPLS